MIWKKISLQRVYFKMTLFQSIAKKVKSKRAYTDVYALFVWVLQILICKIKG